MPKRLAIYVIYDKESIVDQYIYDIAQAINSNVERLIIVSNSPLNEQDKKCLSEITDYIYERDNIGFDAGAYKDIITQYAESGQLYEYDELVLLNNSFFGFFYDISEFFETAENMHDIDFVGMTRGRWNHIEHIQSYFILIKKSLLDDNLFIEFWRKMRYANTLEEAIEDFEVKFTTFFSRLGYKCKAVYDICNSKFDYDNYFVFLELPLELIKKHRCPVLKIKSIDTYTGCAALEYVSLELNKDVTSIYNYIKRSCHNGKLSIDAIKLKSFCNNYTGIYIYGAGIDGHHALKYLNDMKYVFNGFVVSQDKMADNHCTVSIDSLEFKESDGIILALNEKNRQQVLFKYTSILKDLNVFVPGNC